ncbi:MAG: hypothetical protein M1825_004675 [Sarcosagium campestre]|nr:MAG: hypothetical protein M1825_004675 [Sarcosagium campestre]
MRVVTIECLNTLRKAVIQAKNSGQETILLEEVLIYIVLRSTLIMRESGFVENATATWQAMLDLHFSEADALKKPKSTALEDIASSIEEFWESEGPRIGEINSAVAQEAALPVMPHLKPGYLEDWARTESIKLSTSTMPAKTVDEVDEEDPYRVVFFSDIKDHLVVCTSESSRMAVLNAFLAFCRLPLLLSDDSDRSRKIFSTDAFIRGSPCGSSDDFVQRIIEPSPARSVLEDAMMPAVEAEQINRIKEAEPFDVPLQNFDCSTFEIFSRRGTWVSAFQSTVQPSNSSHHPWIRQTLRSLLAAGVGGYSLAEYFIGFELAYYPSSVRKTARDLVKKHPSSLRLYNAYALVEWRLDRIEAARKVFATALDMAHTLPENERQDEILLLRTWIWEILQDGGGDEALCKLLSISGGTENDDLGSQISTAAVLRTRRALENGLSLSLRSPNAIHYADVLALLFYLSESRSLKAALASFARSEEIISPESPCLALLHQARARVLYYHATHLPSATPPASLRAPLAESIRRLPHNTIFLALHGWNEARFRIADRLRATLRDDVLRGSSSSVIGWAFAIWTEIRFGGTAGGNANSVRAVFERALANDSTKSSVLLWTVYVHFSLQRLSPADTAAVFFRGMRACPWAKSFYLLAFSHLGAVLSAADRRMVWRIMGEKELRVFVDLDETNVGWGD